MSLSEPFDSGVQNVGERQKQMLEAVANAGTAGRKAFEDAEKEQATAQKEALARALQREQIAGLGGLGTEQGVADTFGRYGSALSGNRAAFESGLEGTRASGESYFQKLGATLPLLQEQNKAKIDARDKEIQAAIAAAEQKAAAEQAEWLNRFNLQQEAINERQMRGFQNQAQRDAENAAAAERSKGAKFPKTEVIGATQMALEQAKQALPSLQANFKREKMLLQVQRETEAEYNKSIDSLRAKMKTGQWQAAYSMGDGRAMQEKGTFDKLVRDKEGVKAKIAKLTSSVSSLDQQVKQVQGAMKNPTGLSRDIAITQYGQDPTAAYGNLTDSTWAPILNAAAKNDLRGTNEQAQALASKLKIQGGAKLVQEILNKGPVRETIQEAQNGAYEQFTWDEAKTQLADTFLRKGQDRTYKVLVELLRDYPWRSK